MNVKPIAEYLAAQGFGVLGEDIFIGSFPATVKAGVLVRGGIPAPFVDPNLPGYFVGTVQFIVRGAKYEESLLKATEMAKKLSVNESTLGGLRIKQMYPTSLPAGFNLSDAGFNEFSFKVAINFVDLTWV